MKQLSKFVFALLGVALVTSACEQESPTLTEPAQPEAAVVQEAPIFADAVGDPIAPHPLNAAHASDRSESAVGAKRGVLDATASAITSAIIDNGTVQLGVYQYGNLNVDGGSRSSGTSPTTWVGLRYMPTNGEATAPGCLCEGWGVADASTGLQGWASWHTGGFGGLTLQSFTADGVNATSVVTVGGRMRVTHDFRPAVGTPYLYEALVSIENISATPIGDLRYTRGMDWDIAPNTFSEYVTIQGTAAATAVRYASDDGFNNVMPLSTHGRILADGDFVDSGPTDHGAHFDFEFGELAVGAVKEFKIFYGAAGNEPSALDALGTVGAEVYSFGQANYDGSGWVPAPNNGAPGGTHGALTGEPHTFIFGFKGVGGIPVPPPTNQPPQAFIILNPGVTCTYLEGGDACISGGPTFDPDPGTDVADLLFTWDFGDGSTHVMYGVEGMPAHTYADGDRTYTVTLTVEDPGGLTDTETLDVFIANVAPTVDAGPDVAVEYGAPVPLAAHFSDPGVADMPWFYEIQWGDGTFNTGIKMDQLAPIPGSHTYGGAGTYIVSVCVTDKDGAQGCDDLEVLVIDPTPPVIEYVIDGTFNAESGWYTDGVTITWTVTDPESPFTTDGCDVVVHTTDTSGASYTCSAESAGGPSSVTVTFMLDATAPVVTFLGNAGSYDVADEVSITCDAFDATSGIAEVDCAGVSGPAYSFGLGMTTFTASASDVAGNSTTVTGSFEVTVSYGGLCTLVERFVSHAGVANSLCAKLRASEKAKNAGSHNGPLEAFVNEVEAQSGKKIAPEDADVLIAMARALMW